MAYAVQVTERLEGLCVSHMKGNNAGQFVINDILDPSLAAKIGISVGDTILTLNGQSIPDLAKEGGFKDPNCILWDTKLPFTLTLMRKMKLSVLNESDEVPIDSLGVPPSLDDGCEISVEVKEETFSDIMDNDPDSDSEGSRTVSTEVSSSVDPDFVPRSSPMSVHHQPFNRKMPPKLNMALTQQLFRNAESTPFSPGSRSPTGSVQLTPISPVMTPITPLSKNYIPSTPISPTMTPISPSMTVSCEPLICETAEADEVVKLTGSRIAFDSEYVPSRTCAFEPCAASEPSESRPSTQLSQSVSSESKEGSPGNLGKALMLMTDQLLKSHILQEMSLNPKVHFDRLNVSDSNGKMIAVSSKPLESGIHEWTMGILKCDVEIQEIGVCSVCDIAGIDIGNDGVTDTTALGARGIYGSELASDSIWYCSFNACGQRRCFKDLAPYYHIGWTAKDLIKVVVNLEKWRIKFFINGRKVTISVFSTQSFMYSVSMCQIVNFSDFVI